MLATCGRGARCVGSGLGHHAGLARAGRVRAGRVHAGRIHASLARADRARAGRARADRARAVCVCERTDRARGPRIRSRQARADQPGDQRIPANQTRAGQPRAQPTHTGQTPTGQPKAPPRPTGQTRSNQPEHRQHRQHRQRRQAKTERVECEPGKCEQVGPAASGPEAVKGKPVTSGGCGECVERGWSAGPEPVRKLPGAPLLLRAGGKSATRSGRKGIRVRQGRNAPTGPTRRTHRRPDEEPSANQTRKY